MATSTEIKSNNNTLIRVKTASGSITKSNVADQIDASVDYTVQEVSTVKTYVDTKINYRTWRAEITPSSVIRVLVDEIGFTSPVVSNPSNGRIRLVKNGFFTGLDNNKLDFLSSNLNNFGEVYVTLFARSEYVSDALDLEIYNMAGSQPNTPNGNVMVEFRIYN